MPNESQPSSVELTTFPVWRPTDGPAPGCDSIGIADPVVGRLAGDPAAEDFPVWLQGDDGSQYVVVWPEGFSARFEPALTLLSETGQAVAQAGWKVLLQVDRSEAAGTTEDPYFASGTILAGASFDPDDYSGTAFSGCYPRQPD